MFNKSARFYDAIYSFKDYAKETSLIHDTVDSHIRSDGGVLIDVACGTGKHLAEFSKWFDCFGVDLDPNLLAIAGESFPKERLFQGDMRTFDLGFKADVVTCMFSSVAYMPNVEELKKAIGNMAAQLKTGGVLVIEPFLYPESYTRGFLHFLHVDEPDLKVARMSCSEQRENVAVLDFHYLIGTPEGVTHETEHHELGLFTQAEYMEAMEAAVTRVDYDPVGPMGRGLFVGVKV